MYDKLIEKIRCCVEQIRCGDCRYVKDCDGDRMLMSQAADAIESLDDIAQTYSETVQELKMKSQWIPVTERLPEKEDEAVIVWEKQGFALIDWRHDNKWAILDNNCGIATHWIQLPEPPKEE